MILKLISRATPQNTLLSGFKDGILNSRRELHTLKIAQEQSGAVMIHRSYKLIEEST
jgi:hypothetical protein